MRKNLCRRLHIPLPPSLLFLSFFTMGAAKAPPGPTRLKVRPALKRYAPVVNRALRHNIMVRCVSYQGYISSNQVSQGAIGAADTTGRKV
ncbi:hypothetical protein B0A54_09241 [Friedmanniomyces endolithicus]|uniref:Uncharacterized protein n=1 Tax=Friedmanniomyces endolithicus TaxID=329885 RepID=A0A4U0UQQ7_9PEZI|nr:hypothetical protein B0A54_09241 [Friedmanniomyces endolithicus]